MRNTCILGLLAFALFINFGCTNKKDIAREVTGQLYFHLHTNIDTTEVQGYDSISLSSAGRKISMSLAQLYISNIKLVKLDGSFYSVPDKVLLKTFWNELYLIGNVPIGTYKSVQFTVGFDSITSAKTPISSDTVFNHPEMWFSNVAQPQGYIFVNFQGKIDTTVKSNGLAAQMVPFDYKIGTFNNAKFVSLPNENYTVSANQTQYVHLIINFMKLFDGVDLTKTDNLSITGISDNSTTVAKTIASNIPSMFSYEF
jgi:hypothetical protein